MRYCYFCKKAMFSSNNSIWINNKNYDAHKVCVDKSNQKQSEETK